MQVLNDILKMNMEDIKAAMESSIAQEAILKARNHVVPNEEGNRKQRRAAKAIARKREAV